MANRWNMVLLVAGVILLPDKPASAQADSKPDLVVAVAIDQFGSLLFDRWRTNYRGGIKRLIDEGIVFSNAYTSCDSKEWLARKGTVGRATLGELRILDDDGKVLLPGKEGTIYFANGPAFEYHNDPEKTAASRSAEGWTTLGDIGYVDGEGWLFLTDRKAHTIISGGVNLYPQETENVLITHPKVADVAVIGVPNDDFGEEMKAVVQLVDPAAAGPALAEELIAFCRTRLSPLKCPRSVDFDDNLPRQPTGKLYKRLIKDRYWQGRGSRII